jgi:hypothetical protein
MYDDKKMLEAENMENMEEMEDIVFVESETEQDEAEFTEMGAKEDEAADHPTDSDENANANDAVEEAIENKSTSQAEKRRQREAKEAEIRKRIEQESYRKGIIDAIGGVNPYTDEEIKDEADIDEYLLMRELDKQGKDPINDYASAVKGKAREKAEKTAADEKRVAELQEFAQKYPNVDVSALLNDARFGKFAGKRVQHETLATVYTDYLEFTRDADASAEKKAAVKAKATEMKKKASPGSLAGSGDQAKLSYENMSDEAFEKKLAKVLRGEEKI